TPDVNGPMSNLNPQTPGAGISSGSVDQGGYAHDWQTPDIEVRIKAIHDDEDLIGQHGIIRSISGAMCSVFLPKEDRVVSILSSNIEPVEPSPNDMVSGYFDFDLSYSFASLQFVDAFGFEP